MIEYNNWPDPENVLNSEGVVTDPGTLNLGFQVIDPWHQSGNFPVEKAHLKMVSNIRAHNM